MTMTTAQLMQAGREIAEAAMQQAKERHATLRHCQYWSWHKRKLLCYNEWIKETWEDEVTQ